MAERTAGDTSSGAPAADAIVVTKRADRIRPPRAHDESLRIGYLPE
jgi:hypothetical protein